MRQAENSTSVRGSFWERSPLGFWFSTSVCRRVPGTVPESVLICGIKEFLPSWDPTPKMQDSVLMKSWESFFVTLPSFSSETCVIYSSVAPGTDVFRDWLFLGCSCVSLDTAASNFLFLTDATFWGERFNSCEDWLPNDFLNTTKNSFFFDKENISNQ